MIAKAFAAFAGAVLLAQAVRLGDSLSAGMRLVYSSGGVETPWVIDSVRRDISIAGRDECIRIWIRISPAQTQADTRTHCVSGSTMSNWDERAGVIAPARPLSSQALTLQQGGRSVRYEVTGQSADTVSGVVLAVLPTVVSTTDSAGRTVRRLRERFAPAIATATWGVFEVPDSTSASGWRTTREFKLVAIIR